MRAMWVTTALLVAVVATGCVSAGDDPTDRLGPGSATYLSVSAGGEHACGILTTGKVRCWGEGDAAEPPPGTFKSLSAGGDDLGGFTCGIRTDGSLSCWGSPDVARVPSGKFETVSTSGGLFDSACAVQTDKTLACWGDESETPVGQFLMVDVGSDVLSQFFACGVRVDGTAVCWGSNDKDSRLTPPEGVFREVAIESYEACGLRNDGNLECWGQGFSPGTLTGTFKALSLGITQKCGLQEDGTLRCSPGPRPPSGSFTGLSVGNQHACALDTKQTVTCWGRTYYPRVELGRAGPGLFFTWVAWFAWMLYLALSLKGSPVLRISLLVVAAASVVAGLLALVNALAVEDFDDTFGGLGELFESSSEAEDRTEFEAGRKGLEQLGWALTAILWLMLGSTLLTAADLLWRAHGEPPGPSGSLSGQKVPYRRGLAGILERISDHVGIGSEDDEPSPKE